MVWVDLDLNLPPPPPDPDGSPCASPPASYTPPLQLPFDAAPQQEEVGGGGGGGGEAAAPSAVPASEEVGVPFTASEEETLRVLVAAEAERPVVVVPLGGAGAVAVGGAQKVSDAAAPCASPQVAGDVSNDVAVECGNSVGGRWPSGNDAGMRIGDSDEEETVGSRIRGRVSGRVDSAAASDDAAFSGAGGMNVASPVPAIERVEETTTPKPVRKRLRTLGQLRNQKLEKTAPLESGGAVDMEIAGSSSIPDVVATGSSPQHLQASTSSNVKEDSGVDGGETGEDKNEKNVIKEKEVAGVKLEGTSSSGINAVPTKGVVKHHHVIVSEASSHHQDEKMQSEGDEAASSGDKKKGAGGLKDVIQDKRRRSIVVLDAEAQAQPTKRPRLPRSQPIRRSRSFGGVIVGEKLDDGSKSTPKTSKQLESPQSSETGKLFMKLESPREIIRPSAESSVIVAKVNTTKEDGGVVNSVVRDNSDSPSQDLELGEVSGVSEEKQQEENHHPRKEISTTATAIPRRPRKMKEVPVPTTTASRATTRSAKPPPAVKPAEFIRPTVKKPPGMATLRRQPSSNAGQTSRNDLRSPFQDTTIERLQREATCGKLWQSPGTLLPPCNLLS